MDVLSYLRRIGLKECHDIPKPTKDLLFDVQKLHLLNVPYENIDIIMGERKTLDV